MLHALEIVRSGMPSARHVRVPQRRHVGPAADARGRRDARAHRRRRDARPHRLARATRSSRRIRDAARAAFAEALSSEPERIALTHSTSGGMNLVLGGMTFAAGDEIITTDNEHAGLLEPLAALERRYGVDGARGRGAAQRRSARRGHVADRAAHACWSRSRTCSGRTAASCRCARSPRLRTPRAPRCWWTAPRAWARSTSTRPRWAWTPTPGRARNGSAGPNGVGFLWLADGFEERFEVAAPSYYTRDFRSEGQPFWPGARRHDGASLDDGGLAGLAAAVAFRRELVGWSEGAAQMAERARRAASSC